MALWRGTRGAVIGGRPGPPPSWRPGPPMKYHYSGCLSTYSVIRGLGGSAARRAGGVTGAGALRGASASRRPLHPPPEVPLGFLALRSRPPRPRPASRRAAGEELRRADEGPALAHPCTLPHVPAVRGPPATRLRGQSQAGSLTGAVHLSKPNADDLRSAPRGQKPRLEPKGKCWLNPDPQYGYGLRKHGPAILLTLSRV